MKAPIAASSIVSLTFATAACDRNLTGPGADPIHAITVMTRNVFLDADLEPIMSAASLEQIPGLVGEVWNRVGLNDFPARADAIAREIQSTRPDVVGLQEVAKFRIQSPGDFLVGNPQAAEDVQYDYLMLLLDALQARVLNYTIASVVRNGDIELSAITPTGLIDVRWTDHDVILVRDGIQITGESSNNFALNITIPVAGGIPITSRLG